MNRAHQNHVSRKVIRFLKNHRFRITIQLICYPLFSFSEFQITFCLFCYPFFLYEIFQITFVPICYPFFQKNRFSDTSPYRRTREQKTVRNISTQLLRGTDVRTCRSLPMSSPQFQKQRAGPLSGSALLYAYLTNSRRISLQLLPPDGRGPLL